MNSLKFITGYKDDKVLRSAFNRLAFKVFGIDFEGWYNIGGWNDRYICYSYADIDNIVSNVSINIMNVIREGKKKRGLQIGTVMTHPDYRGRGLSVFLMKRILEEHKKDFDFIYLYANEEVFNFYPKFGFKRFPESQFYMDIKDIKSGESPSSKIRKLNISDSVDLKIIKRLTKNRKPVSKILGIENDQHLLLFHCLIVFRNDLYYMENEDIIVIFKQDEEKLLLYDIISRKEIGLRSIIDRIRNNRTRNILFHFIPDAEGLEISCKPLEPDNGLFIMSDSEIFNGNFLFPVTSQA